MCCTLLKCCCCIDLRSGTIVIACLCLLSSAGSLAWTSWLAFVFNMTADMVQQKMDEDTEHTQEEKEMALLFLTATFWMVVIAAVVAALAVLLDIMLLAGAINSRRGLLQAWIVGYAIIYCVFLLIAGLFIAGIFLGKEDYTAGYKITTGIVIHAVLMVYFWVVVRSYRSELRQQYGDGGPRNTAGKVYSTVPTGDGPPIHGTYSYADAMPLTPTAPPQFNPS